MKKKKYIREGGICQFFDQWAENGSINHQKLSRAIFHPETIEQHTERSEESYIVEKMKDSDESSQEEKTEEIRPFNREYKTMTPRIDKIIKKAECIKKYLESNNKKSGNIDGLIKSLTTYRDNIGDIPNNKRFYITMNNQAYDKRLNWEMCIWKPPFEFDDRRYISILDEVRAIAVECIDFTAHIRKTLLADKDSGVFYSMPPEADNNIADAVFDVQTFRVNDVLLSTELINAGLRPTTTDVRFVKDFE